MAFNINATLGALRSFVAASGYVNSHEKGEPVQPPAAPIHAAIYMQSTAVVALTLSTTIELHVANVRIYMKAFTEPRESTETQMANIVSNLMEDFLGDFNLGDTIRNIDAAGQYGASLTTDWGYVGINETAQNQVMYRTVNITVPMIVDGSATPAQ